MSADSETGSGGTSYDEIPYTALAFGSSHPDRLATVAALAGLSPAPLERCRVLELGSGRGGNLLPMAEALPAAELVGIDLSRRQVDEARALAKQLGLSNVRFECGDIAALNSAQDAFDYIICHGVYSWVPHDVQDRILDLCRQLLTPSGLAYISYNVLPGWHLHAGLRDLLMMTVAGAHDARERVKRTRALLDALKSELPDFGTPYAKVNTALIDWLSGQPDAYLAHEYLDADNWPVYFSDFVERARKHELAYVGDASAAGRSGAEVRAERLARQLLGGEADPIRLEQYTDMLFGAQFRRSVLGHATAARTDDGAAVRMDRLRVAARLRCTSERPDPTSDKPERFETATGVHATTNDPLMKTALLTIAEQWPRSVPFDMLVEESSDRLRAGAGSTTQARHGGMARVLSAERRNALAGALMQVSTSGLVELHAWEPPIGDDTSDRPIAPAYARLQAQRGERQVVNHWHRVVVLEELDRILLAQLDGRHDRGALCALVADQQGDSGVDIEFPANASLGAGGEAVTIESAVDDALRRFAATALLTDEEGAPR